MADPQRPSSLARIWALVIALLLGLSAAILYVLLLPPTAAPPRTPAAPPRAAPGRPPEPEPPPAPSGPRAALLFDDMGYDDAALDRLLATKRQFSFAVLPEAPQAAAAAAKILAAGHDLLVHLPCEPVKAAHMKPGVPFLTVDLDATELTRRAEAMIDSVPGAIGANNHMGSRFTAQASAVRVLLAVVQRRGLFFVDSLTSKDSVAFAVAQELGVPSARRDVFLDDDPAGDAVTRQLGQLERLARDRGAALAIGHPRPATLAAVERWITEGAGGLIMVPVSQLTAPPRSDRMPIP